MFLKNKVVLLTGASSGIGKAIAFEMAKKSAKLVLVSRREEVLSELADTLKREYDTQTLVLAKDLSEVKGIEETVEETINAFGHIDYLINSSGMGIFKKAVDFTAKEIDQLFKINTY
ncbi:MAG: SDR family NAD(P)-dependent oxidoreductase, partial [Ruoffia tabacinasalis]